MNADSPALRILILEDHALVRSGMRLLLLNCEPGALVFEAASFEDAYVIICTESIDLAFFDILLPGGRSGIDLLRDLRRDGRHTRVVMLSAVRDEATLAECLRLGASGYISKAVEDPRVFTQAIREVLRGGVFFAAPDVGAGLAGALPAANASLNELGLGPRAIEALYYLCEGLPNRLIAQRMGVQVKTIENDYNPKLFRALGVTNRASLIVEVARRELKPPAPRGAG